MYGRTVTTRPTTQRTQNRSQQAMRPVNYELPGERIDGGLSREEARHQQTMKYREDSQKFAEKEKQKAQKKKEERWKRYSHVDVGQRLIDSEFVPDLESIREQQQIMYETEGTEGLERERQREAARLKREQDRREQKLKRLEHVDVGRRLDNYAAASSSGVHSVNSNANLGTGRLERQMNDINLNVNYNRAMEKKVEHYQGQKLKPETGSESGAVGFSASQMNNLNAINNAAVETSTTSEADREQENRERMRMARERLQKKYNKELHKSP